MVAVYRAKLGKRGTETAMMRKAVALKLADCAHDDGRSIHPAIKTIADEIETSERSVQRVIAGFLEEKLLLLDNDGWSGKTNRYRFNFKVLDAFPRTRKRRQDDDDETGDKVSPMPPSEGDMVSGQGDRVSGEGDTVTPKPSLNHQEPSKQQRARKSKSGKGQKMKVDPVTGISATALAEGYALAAGWDRDELMDKFLSLPEPDNPDAAWLGFCKSQGRHGEAPQRKFKITGPVTPLEPPPQDRITITRGSPEWAKWIEHCDRVNPAAADQLRNGRTYAAYVPSRYPSDKALPEFPRPKVAA
jgi:hypothetical protein